MRPMKSRWAVVMLLVLLSANLSLGHGQHQHAPSQKRYPNLSSVHSRMPWRAKPRHNFVAHRQCW